jgi:hypothetical protein
MAHIARSSVCLALPANAPLTPRTFNEVITIPQSRELLSKLSVLRLELARRGKHLVDPRQHYGIGSSSTVGNGRYTRHKYLYP